MVVVNDRKRIDNNNGNFNFLKYVNVWHFRIILYESVIPNEKSYLFVNATI